MAPNDSKLDPAWDDMDRYVDPLAFYASDHVRLRTDVMIEPWVNFLWYVYSAWLLVG